MPTQSKCTMALTFQNLFFSVQYQMEHQIVLEMESRNRYWSHASSSSSAKTHASSCSPPTPAATPPPKDRLEEVAMQLYATPGGGGGGVAMSTPGQEKGQLFLQNSVDYLKGLLESRDTEIRALKIQVLFMCLWEKCVCVYVCVCVRVCVCK